ncbi:MAG: lysS, partial [Marmoricola sp.]|nr:lysS [Marmoricola sp.]
MTATHDTVEMRPGRGHPPGTHARRAGASPAPLDDRWPDRCAAVMWGFAALVLVVAVVEPWRDYMERPNDPISALTIPIVPSPVYAAL